jgi:hypothetical protein
MTQFVAEGDAGLQFHLAARLKATAEEAPVLTSTQVENQTRLHVLESALRGLSSSTGVDLTHENNILWLFLKMTFVLQKTLVRGTT